MKKLGEGFSEAMQTRLESIGRQVAKNEAEDPRRFTYVCPRCSDTGYALRDVKHPRLGPGYRLGSACPDCTAGQAIRRRIEAERAAKPPAQARQRNERIETDWFDRDEPPPISDEDLPF